MYGGLKKEEGYWLEFTAEMSHRILVHFLQEFNIIPAKMQEFLQKL